uniref:DNA polymerase n=1 Tax=Timema cristinae TaxID=61476 RepID=A0A7R9C9G8_TIMCR|nr:unnamed protein product [Timema cristinae]
MDVSTSPLAPRAKRQKLDKHGRTSAFEKLKQLKGNKHKYEVSIIDNVYEEVDEKEYSEKVLQRQDDDWIVDDDGCGYVEDGREIFDDDLDDDSIFSGSRVKSKDSKTQKRGRLSNKIVDKNAAPESKLNIRNMLLNMPTKKKEETVKLDEDDILGDIMQELNSDNSNVIKPFDINLARRTSKQMSPSKKLDISPSSYLRSLAAVKPKTRCATTIPRNQIDDKILIEDDLVEIQFTPSCIEKFEESIDYGTILNFDSNDEFPASSEFNQMDSMIEEINSQESMIDVNQVEAIVDNKPNSVLDKVLVTEEQLLAGWEMMQGSGKQDTSFLSDIELDPSRLPLTTTESGEKVFRFFWWDAYEDFFKQPGVVFLFGKIWIESASSYVSCCLTIKNIERRIYLLPREEHFDMSKNISTGKEVTLLDVYQEFNEKVATKYKIFQFKSRKVEKKYGFDVAEVPLSSEYLEVRYSASDPVLPSDLQGSTFSHVFGTNTSALELLLLGRKIKGPCWLDVNEPQLVSNPVSWCRLETTSLKPENVSVSVLSPLPPPPPLVVVTLNVRSVLNPKTYQSEVVMIACLVHYAFNVDKAPPQPPFQQHFCAFTRPVGQPWPYDFREAMTAYTATKLERSDSERALLGFFLAKLSKIDPDLIVGHDLCGYDLDILVHRMTINKIPHWSRFGRLRRGNLASMGKNYIEKNATCGRLLCDMKISAKELVRSRSYDLGALCQNLLHLKENERVNYTVEEVNKMFGSSRDLLHLISATMQDAVYILRLMCELNVLPLTLQITNIAVSTARPSYEFAGPKDRYPEPHTTRSVATVQYALKSLRSTLLCSLHRLLGEDFDLDEAVDSLEDPSKQRKGRSNRKKPSYLGGLVLEPKKGFYDKMILLMDFNSLYPSIIQEYNICFTTVPRAAVVNSQEDEAAVYAQLPEPGMEPGVLPTEIRKLVESRREVKKLMKSPDISPELCLQYNIRQTALKLTANSMYGCLGFPSSRFYAKSLAAMVTAKGREILINTKDLVEKLNYEVIYGDTDSIMINTNCLDYDQVFKIGNKIKAEVNRMYRQVELEVDGVFKYMLLLKKKKYAAVVLSRLPNGEMVQKQELKGLDIVRRDWSQLSAEVGKFVVQQILSDQTPDERIDNIHTHLIQIREDLENHRVPLSLLTITKQLTKNPEDYVDVKAMAHVQVAMRINKKGGKKIRQGDTVEYIICEDGTSLPATQRAYHVDELKTNDRLKIDINYYLAQQIHPVVSRLCEPIEGTDAARIADCLGLDPSNYRKYKHQAEAEEPTPGENISLSDEERYKYCDRLVSGNEEYLSVEKCCNPECSVRPIQYLTSIQNQLVLTMRSYIHKYYLNWLICEDPGCTNRIRRVPLHFSRNYPICTQCEKGVMFKESVFLPRFLPQPLATRARRNLSKGNNSSLETSRVLVRKFHEAVPRSTFP